MFCTVKGLEDLGTAKLVEIGDRESAVEYFDSPAANGRSTHVIPSSKVVRRTLGANTRVYCQDPQNSRWIVGRVVEDEEDSAFVRFANKVDRWVPHDNLFIRWRKPIADPCAFLSHAITETPQYANARSRFLESYIRQRAAVGGISALLSSSIELESHQIDVVRRVLNDTSLRHLLADEVGLGKTIEAGVIIRQAVLDDPKAHRIVVVCPKSLMLQWRVELTSRFGLRDLIDDSIWICALDDIEELDKALSGASMLVIDEAHHLSAIGDTAAMDAYAVVSRHTRSVDRLLLLSATPALRNEAGFLRMLHLLDPAVYRLEEEQAFRARILHRQSLAEAVAFLDPQNALSLDAVLDDLAQKLSSDVPLQELIRALRERLTAFPDPDDLELRAAILALRAHLSETYRLHRRILRNRRKSLHFLTPERGGSEIWKVPGSQSTRIESMLEDWRVYAVSHAADNAETGMELSKFYQGLVVAYLEDSRNVARLCSERLSRLSSAPGSISFGEERGLLARIVGAADDKRFFETRLEQLGTAIRTLTAKSKKILVFCSEESTADGVFAYLAKSRIAAAVRHSVSADEVESWRSFLFDARVNVIVCGPAAEEGLNLQGRERVIVHFDLPFAPSRVEQRMGRVDRYGSGSAIRSLVFIDEGSRLQQGWYNVLDQGLGVFNRSIASLQYLLEEELQRLKRELFASGSDSFDIMLADYAGPEGKVNRELRLLDEQDALDELSVSTDKSSDALEEVDGEWKSISEATMQWVTDTLLFEKRQEHLPNDSRSPDPPYRFRYQKPGLGGPATLIPLSGLLYDFIGALDLEAPGGSSNHPLSYAYSAHRKTAVTRGTRVLRYGDVFVEAIKAFSDTDDRGRSFGIWRQHPDAAEGSVALYFRFDFLIETRLDEVERCLKDGGILQSAAARAGVRRRADGFFAPRTSRVWLSEDGEPADGKSVNHFLDLTYSKAPLTNGYVDTNLGSAKLHRLMEFLPETFVSWSDRCARLREIAFGFMLEHPELCSSQSTSISDVIRESTLRNAQREARIRTLTGVEANEEQANLRMEIAIDEALQSGIRTPSVKLDVMGFYVLTRQAYPEFSKDSES
jgi:ATP-dependent helicase HepA